MAIIQNKVTKIGDEMPHASFLIFPRHMLKNREGRDGAIRTWREYRRCICTHCGPYGTELVFQRNSA